MRSINGNRFGWSHRFQLLHQCVTASTSTENVQLAHDDDFHNGVDTTDGVLMIVTTFHRSQCLQIWRVAFAPITTISDWHSIHRWSTEVLREPIDRPLAPCMQRALPARGGITRNKRRVSWGPHVWTARAASYKFMAVTHCCHRCGVFRAAEVDS